jgi:hypothetical protein
MELSLGLPADSVVAAAGLKDSEDFANSGSGPGCPIVRSPATKYSMQGKSRPKPLLPLPSVFRDVQEKDDSRDAAS